MSLLINRRRFMQATSSAVAIGALSSASGRARASTSGELRVNMSGGNWGEAFKEAFVKPFEAENGITVVPIEQDLSTSQIALMVESNNVSIDIVQAVVQDHLVQAEAGYLEKIDYSIFNKDDLDNTLDYCKEPFGFGPYVSSQNMVWNTEKFPPGKPRPTNWAEFWDVEKFPGTRSLETGVWGGEGPFEEALLADGVAMDALYPMDIDRVFASLDRIKPHIRKWWASGSEILQMLRDDVVEIAHSYDGRANSLIDAGEPIEINRNQAKLTWDMYAIPKGSPNVELAHKFIASLARPDRQATLAKLFAQSPSNKKAYSLIPDDIARKLAAHPDYASISYPSNPKWYAEVGPDGLTNSQRLTERWQEWILR
ncbi:ABC transporter substrate-binding protein [Phyllobacterium zundukense]|uniref:ABC transporter substrate-binding protein n=1 Tax=Phyllobacterium zundukense TaxID=1867719 RepID=A0ACD4CVK3_9HYPH|nr:ABC transporter substrate-binding protein [Phyllobacterium zundukense]UXN57605.1 ABC transporter substrate-binding protein [Phyllobacterium zundukense]